jgi:hypothetical protein
MNAVYGIANAGVSRGAARWGELTARLTLPLYVLASAGAGVATGAALGAIGGAIPLDGRIAIASGLALAAVAMGVAGVLGRMTTPLQCDRETPREWVDRGPVSWAVRNGVVLGFGATTRIGFVLWYAVGAGALLTGDWVAGALIYGAYGLTRGAGAWVAILATRRYPADRVGLFAMKHHYTALRVTSVHLLMLSIAMLVAVGG